MTSSLGILGSLGTLLLSCALVVSGCAANDASDTPAGGTNPLTDPADKKDEATKDQAAPAKDPPPATAATPAWCTPGAPALSVPVRCHWVFPDQSSYSDGRVHYGIRQEGTDPMTGEPAYVMGINLVEDGTSLLFGDSFIFYEQGCPNAFGSTMTSAAVPKPGDFHATAGTAGYAFQIHSAWGSYPNTGSVDCVTP